MSAGKSVDADADVDLSKVDFDPDALRGRYRAERDKRLRPDGDRQYLEATGKFSHFIDDDPYVEKTAERKPIVNETEVAVIGGGFAGLLAGARLREAGIQDFLIVEAGGDFGGVWYWNRYPGAQCDIESYCYLPLLEELNYVPKEKYSYSDEIFEHSQRVGRAYDLYERAVFQTRVNAIDWDERLKRWHIRTNRHDDIKARFIIMAIGPASRAKLPGIPGIEAFEGHSFHTSRWDYGYTGGNLKGGMTKLADKRVAVIGSGATAVQCIPYVAQHAEKLYVFQRTPSSVNERRNAPTDIEWAKSLTPGWQRMRRENFAAILQGQPQEKDLVDDTWTETAKAVLLVSRSEQISGEDRARLMELADFRKMNDIRSRVDDIVRDPETAEKLKPWYRIYCKRPTFNDEYLPAFNRNNVELIDVSPSKGVERISRSGVVANGKEYEVDCIIFASGFEITSELYRRFGMEIRGEGGLSIFDHWKDGYRTLHGLMTRRFPNWFYIGVSQNAFDYNMTAMFDDQARHIAYIIKETKARGGAKVQPSQEAQDAWVDRINGMQIDSRAFFEACTPGYYNNEGEVSSGPRGGTFTLGVNAFNALLKAWRETGEMEGLEIGKRAFD